MIAKNSVKNIKVLITGGHLTPALAVLEELKRLGVKSFIWVGRKYTMAGDTNVSTEYSLIHEKQKIPFVDLISGKLVRFWNIELFIQFCINLVKIPIGFLHALITILQYQPTVIVSFGGYTAVPIVIVAWFFGIPRITHEQTVVSGLANRIVAQFANKVLISWEESRQYFPSKKVLLTGNPVRKEVLVDKTNSFQVNRKLPTVYITGGNQGAHLLNKAVEPILGELLHISNIIHQTGTTSTTNDLVQYQKLEKKFKNKTEGAYLVRGSIFGEEIGEVFEKADIVVSRAGANISTELLALGKLCILVPIPWSINDEQLRNAQLLERQGIATIIDQKELTSDRLFQSTKKTLDLLKEQKDFKGESLAETVTKAKSLVKQDAAERIAKEIIMLAEKN